MSKYITHYEWVNDEELEFQLNTGEIFDYRYKKAAFEERHYLQYNEGLNNTLITTLGIKDPYKWAEDVLGYSLNYEGWPEAKSKEDLLKLIDALCKYNNPKYIIKEDFIVEEYPVLTSEINSFYSADNTEVTFEKLNLKYALTPCRSGRIWWYATLGEANSSIFTLLKIKNKSKFVQNIVKYVPSNDGPSTFPEVKTVEDAYKVMDALIAEYIKQFQPKTTIKTNNYGDSKIELRRKKADMRVGSCPAGSIVYGKRSKASVRSRRISYQTCIGN